MDTITERQKSLNDVLATCRSAIRETAAALEELLGPELAEGETLPDLVLLQELFGRALARRGLRLLESDEAFVEGTERHRRLAAERTAEIRNLYGLLVSLRGFLRDLLGAAAARLLGLHGGTSRDPVVLLRQAGRAESRLRDLTRPIRVGEVELSADQRQRRGLAIAEAAKALEVAVVRASLAVKELDATRLERKVRLADFNAVFVAVAAWFEATFRVIGRDDRAAAVRPSRQYLGLTHRRAKGRLKKARAGGVSRSPATPRPSPAGSRAGTGGRLLSFPSLRRAFRRLTSGSAG